MANRDRAKNMAARGASAQKIRQATGVTPQAARNFVSRAAPATTPVLTNAGPDPMASAAQQSKPAAPMQIRQPNGNPIVTQAPARPADVQASYVDAGSGKSFNTRFVPGAMQPGQVGYDPNTGGGVWTAGGMSDEEIRAFYRSSNPLDGGGDSFISMSGKPASAFTLEGLYGSAMPSTTAATDAGPTNTAVNKKPKSVAGAIRTMGVGGISKQELDSIMKGTKKSGGDIVQRLDKINTNLKEEGKTGINLRSGAANMLIRRATKKPPMSSFYKYGGDPLFGTGKLGKTLQGMLGSRSTGGYINPISGQQSRSAAVGPTFLARGMDLMPGGRQTVRGVGKQYEYTPGNKRTDDVVTLDTNPPPLPGPGAGAGAGAGAGDSTVNTGTGTDDITQQMEQDAATQDQSFDAFTSSNIGSWRPRGRGKKKGLKTTRTAKASDRFMPKSATLG